MSVHGHKRASLIEWTAVQFLALPERGAVMNMKTISAVFSSFHDIERAVSGLEGIGVPSQVINVIAGNDANRHQEYLEKAKHESRTSGSAAATGASIGGGLGIVAALVSLAIPGVGTILAGGAIVSVLAGLTVGAAGGGLMSALFNMGVPHEDAPLYEEAVRRNELLLVVEVDVETEGGAIEVIKANGGRELKDMADTWRAEGWTGPHTNPHPYVYDSTYRSHE